MADQAIMEKVLKVKTLMENAATEGEAAAAAEALTRLMIRHSIEMNDIDGAGRREDVTMRERVDIGKGGQLNWRRDLLATIAHANGCISVYYAGTNTVSIVGRTNQIDATIHIYTETKNAILRIAKEGYKAYSETTPRPDWAPVWNHSFCLGALATIRERLRNVRHADTETVAIVLVMDKEVQDYYDNGIGRSTRSIKRHSDVRSADGWYSGKAAGNSVNLGQNKAIK